MKYEGYMVGPALRKLRTDRGLSILQASNLTGLSTSSLNQIEQGGRNLSMKSLFLFMNAYEVDANTVLDIKASSNRTINIARMERSEVIPMYMCYAPRCIQHLPVIHCQMLSQGYKRTILRRLQPYRNGNGKP